MKLNLFPFLLAFLLISVQGCSRPENSPIGDAYGGDSWLRWDKQARLAFVMGNLRGNWDGQATGCAGFVAEAESRSDVSGLTPAIAEQLRLRCENRYKPSKRSFQEYEEVITKFYEKYPEQRRVDIQDIISVLANDRGGRISAEDIHNTIKTSSDGGPADKF